MELWKKQLIRKLFPYSSTRLDIEPAFMIKHPHVPKLLYKYRQFVQNHIDALNKNVLWMSSPDRFNDPYDAAVSFNPDRFFVEDESAEDFIAFSEVRDRNIEAGGTWRPRRLVRPIRSGDWRRKILSEQLKDVGMPFKDKIPEIFDKFFKKHYEDMVKNTCDSQRNGFSVLSLSEIYSSTLMWSHYSDSHRGFAIEYDFSTLGYGDLRRRLCFPVFYTKKLRDATRYMARVDMSDFNSLFGQFMCLIKRDDWDYEREWRIVHALGPPYANAEMEMPEPSAIILGSQVKQADEEAMRDLCRTRSISLKRMVQVPGSFDLDVADVML